MSTRRILAAGAARVDPDVEAITKARDPFDAAMRLRAKRVLGLSSDGDIDLVKALARNLFAVVKPGFATGPTVSDRDVLKGALEAFTILVFLGGADVREDLLHIRLALSEAFNALRERDRGFDEPLLRALPRSGQGPREEISVRIFKATAAVVHDLIVTLL